jgi:hypothetical protein
VVRKRRASHHLSQPTGLNPVAGKASRKSSRKCAALKRRILSTIRGADTQRWTVEDLMQAVDCSDRELLLQCCQELVKDGHMDKEWRLPPDRPAAEHLPEHLPEHMAFDLSPEQLKEREELRGASKNIDRALAGVKVKPTSALHPEVSDERRMELLSGDPTRQTPAHKRIRKFAFEEFGDWDNNKVSTSRIMNAAVKNPEYMREAEKLESESTFNRALGRK